MGGLLYFVFNFISTVHSSRDFYCIDFSRWYLYIYLYTCTTRKPPNYSPGWLDDVHHLNCTIYFGAHDVVNGKPFFNHPPSQTYVDAFEIYLSNILCFDECSSIVHMIDICLWIYSQVWSRSTYIFLKAQLYLKPLFIIARCPSFFQISGASRIFKHWDLISANTSGRKTRSERMGWRRSGEALAFFGQKIPGDVWKIVGVVSKNSGFPPKSSILIGFPL